MVHYTLQGHTNTLYGIVHEPLRKENFHKAIVNGICGFTGTPSNTVAGIVEHIKCHNLFCRRL